MRSGSAARNKRLRHEVGLPVDVHLQRALLGTGARRTPVQRAGGEGGGVGGRERRVCAPTHTDAAAATCAQLNVDSCPSWPPPPRPHRPTHLRAVERGLLVLHGPPPHRPTHLRAVERGLFFMAPGLMRRVPETRCAGAGGVRGLILTAPAPLSSNAPAARQRRPPRAFPHRPPPRRVKRRRRERGQLGAAGALRRHGELLKAKVLRVVHDGRGGMQREGRRARGAP